MGIPAIIVSSGGLPVTISTNGYGLPMTLSTNGYGVPITQAIAGYGLPVVGVSFAPTIEISAFSVLETAPINTTVGTLSLTPGTTGTPVFTLTDSAGGKFNILGTALRTNALLDYETATFHTITIAVSGVTPAVSNRTLPIIVINVVGPAAPVLDLITDASDTTPDFTLTGDLVLNDVVRFQYSTSAVFSGASELTNTIDAAEDTANAITFTTGALGTGTWYFRARIERATEASDWSNTETITFTTSAEVSQFLARTTSLDGTHTAAYTALIDGLVADGIWAKLDALYIFATQSTANALLNLKSSSYTPTIVGTLTFTADDGYRLDASGANYINTNLNASIAGGNYIQNSAHMSVWVMTEGTNFGATIGTLSGGTREYLMPNYGNGGSAVFRINTNAGVSGTVANGVGCFLSNRSSSVDVQGYLNGSSIATGGADSSASLNNANFTFSDESVIPDDSLISGGSFGSSLTSTEVGNFYTRMRAYMTAVGVP